jgi:hypothetical protein
LNFSRHFNPQKAQTEKEAAHRGQPLFYDKPRFSPELFEAAFVGNSQFPAALLAAACQHFATIAVFHAAAEAVFVFAGAARRLECAFHRFILLLVYDVQKTERKGNFRCQKKKLGVGFC